ncbi:hypothetical protein BDV93DRAFT_519281 [Ceratobasidium sp. AG-I]|nr:hypothetical protein BDV93DRAFT_519281 [Ceratobasidium sp. AG-I]
MSQFAYSTQPLPQGQSSMGVPYYNPSDFSFMQQHPAPNFTAPSAPSNMGYYYPADSNAIDSYSQISTGNNFNSGTPLGAVDSSVLAPPSETYFGDYMSTPLMDLSDLDAQSLAAQQAYFDSQVATVSVQQQVATPIQPAPVQTVPLVHPIPRAAPVPVPILRAAPAHVLRAAPAPVPRAAPAPTRATAPKHISSLDLLEANIFQNPGYKHNFCSWNVIVGGPMGGVPNPKSMDWEVILKHLSKQQFKVFYYEQLDIAQSMKMHLPPLPVWIQKYCFGGVFQASKSRKAKGKSRADKLKALPDRVSRERVVAKTLLNRGGARRPAKLTARPAPY